MSMRDAVQLAQGVHLGHLFYRFHDRPPREVQVRQPPCCGWQLALIVGESASRRTIVCPFTLKAWNVTADCYELNDGLAKPKKTSLDPERWSARLLKAWDYYRRAGIEFDADDVATALRRLGAEPPSDALDAYGEARVRGGKEVAKIEQPAADAPDAPRQFKTMKRDSKRAVFLLHALTAPPSEPHTVRHYMDHFDMSRSNVLSYWWGLNKDQGVGYTLMGDAVQFELPVASVEELLRD